MGVIALVVVGGAIGGLLGALLTKLLVKDPTRSNLRTILVVVPIVLFGAISQQLARSPAIQDRLHRSNRLMRAARKYEQDIPDSVKARMTGLTPSQRFTVAQGLTHAGMKRLPAADLERWNELRLKIADGSPQACAGLWTGREAQKALQVILSKFSDRDLDEWARITIGAMRLEMEQKTFAPAGEPLAVEVALPLVVKAMPALEAAHFRQVIAAGTSATDDEACWGAKTLMTRARLLAPASRESVLRMLASL